MGARKTSSTEPGLMPLAGHLIEARKRIFRVSIGAAVAVVVGYVFADVILDVLRAPIVALAESRNATLNYDSVSGAFELKMRIALYAGVVLSSPVWLYQLFAFFAPALTRRDAAGDHDRAWLAGGPRGDRGVLRPGHPGRRHHVDVPAGHPDVCAVRRGGRDRRTARPNPCWASASKNCSWSP
jgi:hypothetical protein